MARTTPTGIGLQEEARQGVAGLLYPLLADEYVLYTKTRNFHWNVVGRRFHDLHQFFQAQYEALAEAIDAIAERARVLGAKSPGSLAEFLKHTRLTEQPGLGETPGADAMIAALLADHEAIIRSLRADVATAAETYGDLGTSDFLTGLMEDHEKMAWMLRAHLEGGE